MTAGDGGFPACALWDFSLAVYGRPGVAEACLALQDGHGLDVNLLLYCLWTAADGRGPLDRPAADAARSAVRAWGETVVTPLRALRRRLKPAAEGPDGPIVSPCRAAVKAAELAAEHAEQLLLARLAPPPRDTTEAGRVEDAGRSLRACLEACGAPAAAAEVDRWRALLRGAFPGAPEAAVAAGLGCVRDDAA